MLIQLCRIGQDAVTRFTTGGTAITSISCAYSVGFGERETTQWIEAEFWGERGQKLAEKLTKGRQIVLTANDVCVETYPKSDNTTGVKLKCRVVDIDFTSGNSSQANQAQ
ncbi:single-stranded DNA-binding protein [Shewanella baltica]|uniref:single-stranded DNA-binding protein n=1 Tax=Shewanella baltica TaxID=62322 RepID=UPI0039AFBA46